MASLRFTARALDDIDRLVDFLLADLPASATSTVDVILHGVGVLEAHPLIGRIAENGRRELVISRGRSGYLALYRYLPRQDVVYVLAIRHQRKAGFEED